MRRIALALAAMVLGLVASRPGVAGDCPACGPSAAPLRPCRTQILENPGDHWVTPVNPACTPWFAAGAIADLTEPPFITVIRLQPIKTGPPVEPPPPRPYTREPVPPRRINLNPPPVVPEDPPLTPDRPPTPPVTPPTSMAKLHLLILADTEAKDVGRTHAAGADLLTALIRAGVRRDKVGSVVRRTTDDLTPEKIAEAIADLPAKPEDAILVYYAGAAEYDETAMGFLLTPSKSPKKLPRIELKKSLESKKVRLAVLLTDPATHPLIADPPGKPPAPTPPNGALDSLFFNVRGIVDVHAASVGEFAAARGGHGGCFTVAVAREFGRPEGGWADMLENVKITTNGQFKLYRTEVLKSDDVPAAGKALFRNQESQYPAVLTPLDNLTPVRPASAAPFLLPMAPVEVAAGRSALIQVKLPAAATLLIDGQPTTQAGPERFFETSPLTIDREHVFELKIELDGWYGVYRVPVTAGRRAMVDLQVPATVVAR